MTPKEFVEKLRDRIDWVENNCPEVLGRPVMVMAAGTDKDMAIPADIFVEEFIIIQAR